MKPDNKCIIVVPVYHNVPDELEQLSLKQLDKIVLDIDIYLIGPNNINYEEYSKLFSNNYVMFKKFDNKYFESQQSYSSLCLEYDFYNYFYNSFSQYEYMMIYQTDCWIFRNEIKKFCEMGYDYIGAPIYSSGSNWPGFNNCSRPIVGNGGLSLRKISTMKKLTDKNGYLYNKYKDEWNDVKYEDMFICDVLAHDIYINIPDYRIAEQFSIDTLPIHMNKLNPMAAHRVFALYNYWKNRIKELNDDRILSLCKTEYEKFVSMYK